MAVAPSGEYQSSLYLSLGDQHNTFIRPIVNKETRQRTNGMANNVGQVQ